MKRVGFLFVLLCLGTTLFAQTMSSLPKMLLKPFENNSKEAMEIGLGSTIRTMVQTALDRSLVFMVPSVVKDFSFSGLKSSFQPEGRRRVFLMDAFVTQYLKEIQVDIRIYDTFTETLVDTYFFKVTSFFEVRDAVNILVEEIEEGLFRDTLSQLKLKTTPANCDIYLDNRFMGTSDGRGSLEILKLMPGSYTLKALASGFMDYEDKILIRPRHISNITAVLSLEPGILVIESNPTGAEIVLDGKSAGITPMKFEQIEPGEYNVQLKLDSYKVWENKIIVASRQEKSINATLDILPGSFNIITQPSGAEIAYDGKVLGRSPYRQTNLEPGKYLLEITRPDYESHVLSAIVNPGKDSEYTVELTRQTGFLSIYSTPEKAKIFVVSGTKREYLGDTPLEKKLMDVGTYTIELEKEGFQTIKQKIKCRSGETSAVDKKFAYIPGSIRVKTEPTLTSVYLDGAYKGISPLEIRGLLPGKYRVKAQTAYDSKEEIIVVAPDSISDVTLKVEKQADAYLAGIILVGITLAGYFSVIDG